MSTIGKDKQLIMSVPRTALFGCFNQFNFNGFIREELFSRQMANLTYYHNSPTEIQKLFSERGPLEKDWTRKQIIPYVVVGSKKNGTFLSYLRPDKGNEERLHGKGSIGFGGHIETEDTHGAFGIFDAVGNCARREIKEELSLMTDNMVFDTLGYINDDTNDVGKVHFGVVLYLDVSDVPNEDVVKMLNSNSEVDCLNFRTLENLMSDGNLTSYETWSSYILPALEFIFTP